MDWLVNNYIEVIGAVTGLIYLYLEIRQNIWLWPVGIVTSAFYIHIFFASKFYADMGLQVYYLVISIYGWYHWLTGGKAQNRDDLPVTRIDWRTALFLLPVTAVIFAIIAFVLIRYTDSPVPLGDAFTTALSITATWMLARKIIEQWWVWVVVNLVSLGLYVYKGLYPTSVLFFFYFSMAIVGYFEWKKAMERATKANL